MAEEVRKASREKPADEKPPPRKRLRTKRVDTPRPPTAGRGSGKDSATTHHPLEPESVLPAPRAAPVPVHYALPENVVPRTLVTRLQPRLQPDGALLTRTHSQVIPSHLVRAHTHRVPNPHDPWVHASTRGTLRMSQSANVYPQPAQMQFMEYI